MENENDYGRLKILTLVWFGFQVIAEYLQKIDPKSDGAKRDWVAIYDECASVLYQVASLLYQKLSSALLLNCFNARLCAICNCYYFPIKFMHEDSLF